MTGLRCRWLSLVAPFIIPLFAAAGDVQVATDNGSGLEARLRVGSHVDIPLENARIKEFMMQLARSEQQARLTELAQKFMKDAILSKDPINAWKQSTELQKELQKLITADAAVEGIDKELMRQLLEQFQANERALPGTAAGSSESRDPELSRGEKAAFLKKFIEGLQKRNSAAPAPPEAPRPFQQSSSADRPEDLQSNEELDAEGWFEQWLLKKMKDIDPNHEIFQSPALQEMFREFNRFTKTDEWNRVPRNGRFNALGKQVVGSIRRLNLDRLASHMRLPPLRNLSVTPSTNWRLPRIRIPSFNLTSPSAPNLGMPNTPATPSKGFITFALSVALIGLVWYLWVRYRRPASTQAALAAVPEVWPVAPESVSTKDELIRAFEYVSLLQLGRDARSQHHRALAEGLGGTEPKRRSAAQQLADVYEQARYAPEHEPLPDGAIVHARSSLALLAGVTHS